MFKDLRVQIKLIDLNRFKLKLNQAQYILLVTHRNPDADAIGSLTAMMQYLDQLNKNYTAFCYDKVPDNLEHLYRSEKIINNQEILKTAEYDLIISLDCGALNYSGIGEYLNYLKETKGVCLVDIDHHFSNYGNINLVDSQASAAAIILYEIFKLWEVRINKEMATSLLAGILVDTGNYSNSGTTVAAVEISAELIKLGARFGQISQQLYKNKSSEILKFWSKVLSRLKKNDKLKIVYTVILLEDLDKIKASNLDSVANFFNYLPDAKLAMILKEVPSGEIKVSLRTSSDEVDVEKIAKFFGGGGHTKAAGFLVKGHLELNSNGSWQVI